MKNLEKEPWQIAAARFFVENSENGFTKEEYKNFVLSKYKVDNSHLEQFWEEEIYHPTGRQWSRNAGKGSLWIPPMEMVSMITDYDELVEARNNAKQAFILSIIAIVISAASLIVSIFE